MPYTVRISNSRVNSYGFRLLTSGVDLTQYQKNPILLFNHNRPWRGTVDEVLPIGKVENVRIEGDDIIGELVFDEKDEFARKIKQKWDDGIYRMVSIGATIIEMSNDPSVLLPGQTRETITRWRLDEVSVVDIGANDDAMALKYEDGNYVVLSNNKQPDFISKLKNNEKSMKNIAMKLGLSADAEENSILQTIENLQKEIVQLKQNAEQANLQSIELVVKKAIEEKRILESQRNHFVELGKKVGIDDLKTTLDAIQPAIKPMDIIQRGGNQQLDASKKWNDYTDAELIQLRQDNPEVYAQLYKKEFGIELKF
jgi:hypothetical protein